MSYTDLFILVLPETIVAVTALVALLVDLLMLRQESARGRMRGGAIITTLGCAAAGAWVTAFAQGGSFYDGTLVIDRLTQWMTLAVLALTVFTAWISTATHFTDHVGEYFALLLLATVGMMFLVSTENLLMLFIALELLSLSLYILTAFNKQDRQSAEAALKYFLFGGMSAAIMLFGLSLVYGLTGEINLAKIAGQFKGHPLDPLLIVALIMVFAGFGFKVAAVPFHLWAPDTYQGAPTASAAFIASGSKVASFFILAKVMMVGFAGAEGSAAWRHIAQGWVPLVALIAALSILLGNLAAIAQSSVRRLLAYSAVAQGGYMLVGLLANNRQGLASVLYYVLTYALTVLGALGVVAVVQEKAGAEKFSAFAGLARRSPVLAFCMLIFLLSLAGIPPLAGFFGKFYLFAAALGSGKNLGLLWLVILAVAMSAVSLYYYLQVLKQIYVAEAPADAPAIRPSFLAGLAIVLLALGVVVLGCAPSLLLDKLLAAIPVGRL